MAAGSNLFGKATAKLPHTETNAVADLRKDMVAVMGPLAALTVEEYTNPAAAAPAGLEAAAATTVAPRTVTTFLAPAVAALLAFGRNVTFTTAGATPANAPATALVTGTDIDDAVQTETVTLAQTATIATGVKIFKTVRSVVYAAADGTAATVAIGFGDLLGMSKKIKARAGLTAAVKEIAVGAVVTTGTFDATNRSYLPATLADGTRDYCLYYEYDPSAVSAAASGG